MGGEQGEADRLAGGSLARPLGRGRLREHEITRVASVWCQLAPLPQTPWRYGLASEGNAEPCRAWGINRTWATAWVAAGPQGKPHSDHEVSAVVPRRHGVADGVVVRQDVGLPCQRQCVPTKGDSPKKAKERPWLPIAFSAVSPSHWW